jgi:hypothetical protein
VLNTAEPGWPGVALMDEAGVVVMSPLLMAVTVSVEVLVLPPQTFATPPPPHVCAPLHVPQVKVPPQPSEIVPQVLPCDAQLWAVQATVGVTVRVAVAEPESSA